MGERPSTKHSLDRIDNNIGYNPANCRWATAKMQNCNTRNNHWITFRGKTKTLTDWARETGFNETTLSARLQRGWSVEKALTAPLDNRGGYQGH